MAEVKTEQDPSIEEILESIRQIISDDSGAEAKPAVAKPVASASPQPAPQQPMEKVLDLTEKVAPPQPAAAAPTPAPAPAPAAAAVPKPQPAPADNSAALLSNATAEAATAAMAKLLSGNVAVERDVPGKVGNITLEDMTRDLIRPLVKSWLDQNLPQIIEKMVQKEIEKISRRAMDQ